MNRRLLVVPTGHGVGLTSVCLGLVRALDRLGVRVGFFKPVHQIEAGRSDEPDRSTALVRLTSAHQPPEPIAQAEVERLEEINCHHNYTEQETHFGKTVWLSRKGAINAEAGRPGLIPGSMGTASYVVSGLGNPLALNSAPHGAGRAFSRSAARRTFSR